MLTMNKKFELEKEKSLVLDKVKSMHQDPFFTSTKQNVA